MLETATLRLMLMSLTDGEIKLYAYLCYMIGATLLIAGHLKLFS